MTRARQELISLDSTPYYHCISRCVRRAFLWGEDSLTGKSYAHRKSWVINRLQELADIFAIDIAAYAVMSNHYHLVLRIDRKRADQWTIHEVIERWERLYKLPMMVARYRQQDSLSRAELSVVEQLSEKWRKRLHDISWFMRGLNEHLARLANAEDNCTGRFWEGRFKSQALLDDAAVLTAMSYVDLNPIRAAMAETPETSEFTSIAQRIAELNAKATTSEVDELGKTHNLPKLMGLVREVEDSHPNALGFCLSDYLELVDWTGRAIRDDKRGYIDEATPPILSRLGLDAEGFIRHVQGRNGKAHTVALGHAQRMRQAAEAMSQRFIKGLTEVRALYLPMTG